jgi:DNA mismatch repair protein MutS
MFEQYLAIKQEYPNTLLFYRMGDFYELFFEDAEIASRELQITLTSRNSQAESPVPMCGVPHHAAEAYLSQLLEKGYTVAICDQIEDPKTSKGLVKRAVTMVRTPGTAVEDSSLSAKNNSYLGALYWDTSKGSGGFAWLEYSTGAWSGLHTRREAELWQWVQKMGPRELLVPDLPSDIFRIPKSLDLEGIALMRLPARSFFDFGAGVERLKKVQCVQEVGALGLNGKEELVRACGAILGYLAQTQKQELSHLSPFSPLNVGRHLVLDEITERNLEIFRRFDGKKGVGTLWHVLDDTKTPMGGRLLEERMRHPWRDLARIAETAEAVEYLHDNDALRQQLREALNAVYDLERLSTRISLGRSLPRDFVALRQSLFSLEETRKVLLGGGKGGAYPTADEALGKDWPRVMQPFLKKWDSLGDLADLLERALVDSPPVQMTEGGLFRQGYHAELDELLDLAEHGEQRLKKLLAEEQAANNLPKLKIGYNRVFGYYFELSRSVNTPIPEHFQRKQSLANAERFFTPKMKELEEKILAAGERRNTLEYRLFLGLRDIIAGARPRILFMASVLAALDFWQSLAEVARKNNWSKPDLHEGQEVRIREGRHPVVEALTGANAFTPNDLRLDEKRMLLLITGPNMSGKSTILRQIAIITILAQMGSFVPARSAFIGVADRIFSRVGASDNLARGQSTFMVEMMETARILRQATGKSLVILDEIGRGTSTFDGLALAWAVVETLVATSGIRTLFATHYHELTNLEGRLPGVHNMNIAIREWGGEIVFLHRLVPGPSDKSYGIEVAKLAGVPGSVVNRAKTILSALDATRRGKLKSEAETAMEQMLPGLSLPAESAGKGGGKAALPDPVETLSEQPVTLAEHPLVATLRETDSNSLTPLEALTLINDWKLLWGGSK